MCFFLTGGSCGGAGERDAITSPSAIDPVSKGAGIRVLDHPAINSVCGVGHLGSLCFLVPAPLQCALQSILDILLHGSMALHVALLVRDSQRNKGTLFCCSLRQSVFLEEYLSTALSIIMLKRDKCFSSNKELNSMHIDTSVILVQPSPCFIMFKCTMKTTTNLRQEKAEERCDVDPDSKIFRPN